MASIRLGSYVSGAKSDSVGGVEVIIINGKHERVEIIPVTELDMYLGNRIWVCLIDTGMIAIDPLLIRFLRSLIKSGIEVRV